MHRRIPQNRPFRSGAIAAADTIADTAAAIADTGTLLRVASSTRVAPDDGTSAFDVITIGETMALVTPSLPTPLETADGFRIDAGGAESNVASHLVELGHRASWASRLGDDPLGRRVLALIRERGVDTRWAHLVPGGRTGLYVKDPGAGVHYYRSGSAASLLSETSFDDIPLGDARVVHLSGITPALSDGCAALIDRVLSRVSATDALISFDVNHRAALWSAETAAPRLLELARRSDVVYVGLDEARTLWHVEDADAVRALIASPRILVVKDADVGATEFCRVDDAHGGADDVITFSAAARVDVVEAVGAGDAFAAGHLSGLLNGLDPADRLALGHRRAVLTLGSTDDVPRASARASAPSPTTVRTTTTSERTMTITDRGPHDEAGAPARVAAGDVHPGHPPLDGWCTNDWFDEEFATSPVMAILRRTGVRRSLEIAERAWDLGITSLELTVQTSEDLDALRAVAEAGRERRLSVGAGTVVSIDDVARAADAGAAYTVSPGFDPVVVNASTAAGLPSLPGVATASEVQAALGLGLRWLKAFPASVLGADWFRAMAGPFPEARFVATGGMTAHSVAPFRAAGVRVVAVGSALEDEAQLDLLAQALVGR